MRDEEVWNEIYLQPFRGFVLLTAVVREVEHGIYTRWQESMKIQLCGDAELAGDPEKLGVREPGPRLVISLDRLPVIICCSKSGVARVEMEGSGTGSVGDGRAKRLSRIRF